MAKGKENDKKSKKGTFIILIVCLFAMVVGGVVGFVIMSNKSSENEIVEQVLPLDEFIVNIKGSNNTYVKFGLAITYNGNDKKISTELNNNLHKIRDSIISIFKDKTVDYMKDSEGLEVVKNEIKEKIDSILEDREILSVYFTNLLLH